jgi:prolyl oligopeptidase
MKLTFVLLFPMIVFLNSCVTKQEPTGEMKKALRYPVTEISYIADTIWGAEVPDPYRWLEDDLNPETRKWIEAQNELTFGYLEKIPYRSSIKNMLEKNWNYARYSAPFKHGDYYYFYKNDGLQNQSVLYRHKENEEPEIFLDPNTFSSDGTTSLSGINFSKDGSLAAYQISEGGSDWRKVIVLNTSTKEVIEDTLKDVKFSGLSWKGNEGFYYSSYDKPKEGSQLSGKTEQHKLYFHKLGQAQSKDELIFGGEKTPRRYVGGNVTEDEKYLIITAANATNGNELYVLDLKDKSKGIKNIINHFDNNHQVVHSIDKHLYIVTDLNAPNKRLVKVSLNKLQPENWIEIIPETKMPLSVGTGGGNFFASYLKDATTQVLQYTPKGELIREIELPGRGTAGGFGCKWEDTLLYYNYTSYIDAGTIFSYHIAKGISTVYKQSEANFKTDEYESHQVFYESKDGTGIPMIITHKKGIILDGTHPTILYGYGGFNISLTPSFSTAVATWLELGGVYAVPNLRGGGEYGKAWHDAGTKLQKQNVFDDFIAAAEFLIKNGYTSPDYLAISGGSNGGLLVGVCMTQRPELFQVALPAVGVLDMLRYHKFTAGAGWAYDYGTVDDSREMFEYLIGYSPYHNLSKGQEYPATMVTTGDHDDRVVPAHSFKFAAKLQSVNDGPNPTLIRIETKAGHGAGKPTSMIIEEVADKYAFILHNMGVKALPLESK